jgi:hypothetical protein
MSMNIEQAINISKGCVMASFMDSETKQAVIEALSQVAISKTETTSEPCEWCEIASACEYEVTVLKDDERWATTRSFMPNFCPNCGRKSRRHSHDFTDRNNRDPDLA